MGKLSYFSIIFVSVFVGITRADYNQQATQQLQEKISSTKSEQEFANPVFLKAVEQLVLNGADPNIAHKGHPEAKLLLLLCIVPLLDKTIDFSVLENTLKVVLEHGGNPNVSEERGTALHHAIAFSSPGMVKLLIEHGADLSAKAYNGQTPQELLEDGIKEQKESLEDLQQKKIPDARTQSAHMQKTLNFIKSLGKNVGIARVDSAKNPPLHNQQATQQLQAKLNALKSETEVASADFLTSVDQLIERGADPNTAYQPPVDQGDAQTGLLLFLVKAPYWDKNIDFALLEKVIQNVLRAGANPNIHDGGWGYTHNTALEYAIDYGSHDMIKLLIEYGADPFVKDVAGQNYVTRLEQQIEMKKTFVKEATQEYIPDHQKKIRRLEQIRDVVKSTKKKRPSYLLINGT